SYAISSQDRMAEQVNRMEDFLIADHDHPCAYLRPLISLYTLDLIADKMGAGRAEIEHLEERWSKFSDQASQLKYKNFLLATLAEDARRVVEIILDGDYWPVPFDPVEKLAGPVGGRVDLSALETVVDQDPLDQIYPSLDTVTLPTTFEQIKQQLLTTS